MMEKCGMLLFCYSYIALMIVHFCQQGLVGAQQQKIVKIVEGIDKFSAEKEEKVEFIEPEDLYGPESLFFLNKKCFAKSFDRFDYLICPFQNISQTRVSGHVSTMLGTWGYWGDRATTYSEMNYINGKSCGDTKMTTKVLLKCDHVGDFEILALHDQTYCTYIFELGLPISCDLLI